MCKSFSIPETSIPSLSHWRSIKQFKKRYSGLKKVSANEWRAIKREMQKQKAAGKEYLLFLNGRHLGPDRVAREMRRYSGIRGRDVEDGGAPIGE